MVAFYQKKRHPGAYRLGLKNMADTIALEHDKMIFREMMSHPVLYTHTHPEEIVIVGDDDHTILPEILKHTLLQRIHHITKNPAPQNESHPKIFYPSADSIALQSIDIIINLNGTDATDLQKFFTLLKPEGILLQQCDLLLKIDQLKHLGACCQKAGFKDLQILHFPQSYTLQGSKTALMAIKEGAFKRISEKKIYNKTFNTHYYNFDMHKAAISLPEFMRKEWVI